MKFWRVFIFMQKIKIPSSDGKNIAANLYSPKQPNGKLAVLCPGYLHTKDYSHLVTLAEGLAEKGYEALSFDPIGTWESDGNINDYKISQYMKDVGTVLDYMLKDKNYSEVLLGGHSRGGGISILVAAEDPRITKVLGIMVSPQKPLNNERLSKWQSSGFETLSRSIPNSAEEKIFEVPFSYAEDRARYSLLESAKKVKVPTIFIWGGMDKDVSFHDSNEIYKVISAPKKIIQIPEIGHVYWENSDHLEKTNAVILRNI